MPIYFTNLSIFSTILIIIASASIYRLVRSMLAEKIVYTSWQSRLLQAGSSDNQFIQYL